MNLLTHQGYGLDESFRYSFFNVISISSCTGFATTDFALWAPVAQFILFILMFVGGCAGSTSGAIKNVRIFLLLRNNRSYKV
ncbi:MAG: hypothetical protein KJ963_00385 [Bacteroidetes bacterium]|nr:hypothetical protein [Bacteroidota bacterium]